MSSVNFNFAAFLEFRRSIVPISSSLQDDRPPISLRSATFGNLSGLTKLAIAEFSGV